MSIAGTAELQRRARLVLDELEHCGEFGVYTNARTLINRSVVFFFNFDLLF